MCSRVSPTYHHGTANGHADAAGGGGVDGDGDGDGDEVCVYGAADGPVRAGSSGSAGASAEYHCIKYCSTADRSASLSAVVYISISARSPPKSEAES